MDGLNFLVEIREEEIIDSQPLAELRAISEARIVSSSARQTARLSCFRPVARC